MGSLAALAAFCKVWKPRDQSSKFEVQSSKAGGNAAKALVPWLILSVFVLAWGLPNVKNYLNGNGSVSAAAVTMPTIDVPALHRHVYRDFPVEKDVADRSQLANDAYRAKRAENARLTVNWLSATGTAILFAALLSAAVLRVRARDLGAIAAQTWRQMLPSLATISLMLALGFVTRYGGTDATL